MKINPVYKKELKISVRTVKMALVLFFYNLLLGIIGLFAVHLSFEKKAMYGGINYSSMLTIYAIIAVLEICLVLFIIPGFTSGSISGERERQTLEILLTTKLRPLDIILGKLESSISSLLLVVFSSLPILGITFAVGGIHFFDLLQLMFLVIVTAIFIGTIGIFFSAVGKTTTLATVYTYGVILFLILGTTAIVYGAYLLASFGLGDYNAGNLILILLVNPIVTIISMITKQVGSDTEFTKILMNYGKANLFVMEHWFIISVGIQFILSVVFIRIAAKKLDPLRQKNK